MKDAHIYLRVSTGKQAASGLGIHSQELACREWAESEGYTVRSVHKDEGLSGSLDVDKRPGLLSALSCVRRGDVLLTYDRSRLGRSLIVCSVVDELVRAQGATTACVSGMLPGVTDDSPEGQMVRQMIDVVSQYMRAVAALKTRLAMQAKRERGEYTGGPVPYGKRLTDDGFIEDDIEEQDTILRAIELRDEGLSYRLVGERLAEEGRKPRSGGKWHSMTIKRLVAFADE